MHRTSSTGISFLLFFFAVIFIESCEDVPRNRSHATVSAASIIQGKELAALYCQSCHVLPDPAQLNAASWENGVLPNMGPRLGIFAYNFQEYPSQRYDPKLDSNYYPKKPVLNAEEWQHIIDYYTATSPDTLPPQHRRQAIRMNLSLFDAQASPLQYTNSMTSFVKITGGDSLALLIISDAARKQTYFLNSVLQLTDSVPTSGPIVDMQLFQNTILATDIGVLNPNNGTFGKAVYFQKNENGGWKEDSNSVFKNLRRPVQVSSVDLNNDGKKDYVTCEFGYLTGSLCWMESKANGGYTRHVLRPLPGAVKACFQDYNHDGRMDIWVLFAQGEEGIFLYTNNGDGTFREQQVLRFPPMNGSSYFELADFNNDGYSDIVYTCGDNADYSPVLKPYHGVYLFLNDGKNTFTQAFFFPIHGCYKAVARDFDKDGDLDIATISYFADYAQQPEESFVYLENAGNFSFTPYSMEAAEKGRWLTMDAGDVDGDGWTDLVLGNFCLGPTISKSKYDWRKSPPFLFLKNKGNSKSIIKASGIK